MKLVLYTAITANYDALRPIGHVSEAVKYVCLNDGASEVASGWTLAPIPRAELDPASRSRWAKFHPHLLFPDYEASIYIDGNFEIVGDVTALAARALEQAPIAFYDHPLRRSQREE